jgi:hypothetical protein
MALTTPPVEEKALYVGEGGNFLTDGTALIPHETIALVGHAEAEGSELWQPVTAGTPASTAPRNSPPAAPPPKPVAPTPPEPDVATVPA